MLRITAAVALGSLAATLALAQTAPPTYEGDPAVYKVIFEDQNFRVIATTRKKGLHDKVHGHPLPSVVYNITDCTTKTNAPDGKTSEIVRKAGAANAVPVIPSHSAENTALQTANKFSSSANSLRCGTQRASELSRIVPWELPLNPTPNGIGRV